MSSTSNVLLLETGSVTVLMLWPTQSPNLTRRVQIMPVILWVCSSIYSEQHVVSHSDCEKHIVLSNDGFLCFHSCSWN